MSDFFVKKAFDDEAEAFRRMIPEDWRKELPNALKRCAPTIIYVGISENDICAGGIIFLKKAPEEELNPEIQERLFRNGYIHIGYLYVPLDKRGRGFGSRFLAEIHRLYPKLWFTCDKELDAFYIRNGGNIIENYVEENVPGSVFILDRSEEKKAKGRSTK